MTNYFRHLATAGLIFVAFQSVAPGRSAYVITVPAVPANIQVPAGNTVFLRGEATGTQNYVCLPSASGFAWRFVSPQATLFINFEWFGRDIRQQITTHFLSPNPEESGTARVTWQNSLDTSAVWARLFPDGSSTDPSFVAAGAIPWLLLEEAGTQRGPTGGDLLANTTFIQRLNTFGGVAPSTGCSRSEDIGATALVPYTADYFFYKKSEN